MYRTLMLNKYCVWNKFITFHTNIIPRIKCKDNTKKINFKCEDAFESFNTTVQMWSNPAAFRLTFRVLLYTGERGMDDTLEWSKNVRQFLWSEKKTTTTSNGSDKRAQLLCLLKSCWLLFPFLTVNTVSQRSLNVFR
jgi:hypothetical protein